MRRHRPVIAHSIDSEDFPKSRVEKEFTAPGKTTESDRHPNPTTNPKPNPYLMAVRYGSLALVHFRTLITLRRVRVRVRVGLELRLGLELGLGLGCD